MTHNYIEVLVPGTVKLITEPVGMGFTKLKLMESYELDNIHTAECLERVAKFLRASKNTNGEPPE